MLSSVSSRPHLVLAALAGVCLAAFLISIPLPRSDGQLLGADGFGYYIYLPSLVIDHDLDFANELKALRPNGGRRPGGLTQTGRIGNPWPIGPALLWLPFFLLAHGLAVALNAVGAGIRLGGCGYWHQSFVLAGNIVYGGVALMLAFDVARRAASTASALWATAVLLCAGNLVYYMTAEPSMAHPVSAFAVGLFYAAWIRVRGTTGLRQSVLLGASLGLIAIVRTQDVVLTIVPLAADFACAIKRQRNHADGAATRWLCGALLMLATALIVFLPQALASNALLGAWWRLPQLFVSDGVGQPLFDWTSPHLADVLFSATCGVFSWHPVYLVALMGVIPLWRKDRVVAAAIAGGVLGQAYLIGSWLYWWQGRTFGGRTFIGCLPLFVMGLAALLDAIFERFANRRRAVAGIATSLAALLVLANLLLFIEHRFVLSMVDRRATWYELGPGRVTFLLHRP